MTEKSYNLKYTGKEIDALLDKANDLDDSAQVPAGGTSGQVLTKKSGTDFDTQWETPEAPSNPLPTGGSAGQVLAKSSNTDFDVTWIDQTGGSGGGSSDSDVVVALCQKDSSGTVSLSMTYDEILSAISANKVVIIKDTAATTYYCSTFVYQYTSQGYGLVFIGTTDSRNTYINTPFIGLKSDGTLTTGRVYRNGTIRSGGSAGQFLRKKSSTDYDTEWADVPVRDGTLWKNAEPVGVGTPKSFAAQTVTVSAGTSKVASMPVIVYIERLSDSTTDDWYQWKTAPIPTYALGFRCTAKLVTSDGGYRAFSYLPSNHTIVFKDAVNSKGQTDNTLCVPLMVSATLV